MSKRMEMLMDFLECDDFGKFKEYYREFNGVSRGVLLMLLHRNCENIVMKILESPAYYRQLSGKLRHFWPILREVPHILPTFRRYLDEQFADIY